MTPHALGRASRLALAVVPIWLIGSFAATPTVAPALRILVVSTGVFTLLRPVEGLLAVSLLCALGDLIAMAFDAVTVRVSEALVVAFLAGWLLTATGDRERGPSPIVVTRYTAWALAAIIVASLAVSGIQAPTELSSFWLQTGRRLWHEYLSTAGDPIGAIAAARLLEGIGLAAAVVILFRFKPMLAVWIPEALGAGAVVAAVAAILLWRGIAFPQIMARYRLIGYRVVAHVADLNAAGSYFSLILFIAGGLAVRERGRKCAVWIGIASSALVGLWLSGSRSAEAAVVLVGVATLVWRLTHAWTRCYRLGVIAAVVALLVASGIVWSRQLETDPTNFGGGFRTQFTKTSYRIIRARPWFGIGIGQYYPKSPLFLSPELAWAYGAENAHDYFLQLTAELGFIGLAACGILLASIVRPVARSLARRPDDSRLLGLTAGVAALLLTCLTGHPLLVSEVAFSFWIAAGLMVALASPVRRLNVVDGSVRPLVVAAAVAWLAVSVPIRARYSTPIARRGIAVEGLYDWEEGSDGRRYRRSQQYASVFVDRSARRVEIPMRAPWAQDDLPPVTVEISINGVRVSRAFVKNEWTRPVVDMPGPPPLLRIQRINFRTLSASPGATPPGGRDDGDPAGVQIGDVKIVR